MANTSYLKPTLLITVLAVLTGCATQPPLPAQVDLTIEFYGAKNDWEIPQYRDQSTFQAKIDGPNSNTVYTFPLTQAIACAQKPRIDCKQAVVKTSLEYKLTEITSSGATITGVLHTETGKKLAITGSNANTRYIETTTLPDSAPLLSERKMDVPFTRTIQFGDSFMIDGQGGSKVVLSVNRSRTQ
jgi:hypothetical protein